MEDFIINMFTFFHRRKLKMEYKKSIKNLEQMIDTIKIEKKRSENMGSKSMDEIYNTSIYMALFYLDFSTLIYHLAVERKLTIRKVYCKPIAFLLKEFFDDFPHVFGKKLKQILITLPLGNLHIEHFTEINQKLKHFRKGNWKDFEKIRNKICAHKDLDGEIQLNIFDEIDTKKIQELCDLIHIWFVGLLNMLTNVIEDYCKSMQMVKEISDKIEQDTNINSDYIGVSKE